MKVGRLALVSLVLCVHAVAGAQGSALVPPGDPAYAELDRLTELGLLDSMVVGQRPYSRREFSRIVRLASQRLERRASRSSSDAAATSNVSGMLERLGERFGHAADNTSDVSVEVIDGIALSASATDADRRVVGSASNRAGLEATIDPLARRRLGAPAPTGQVASVDLAHRLEAGSWLAVQASERFEGRSPSDTLASKSGAELLTLFLRARVRNLALSAGRQAVAWTQHEGDGVFFASDAPALDQVILSGDAPFVMPGVLRHLGSTQATLVVADMGPSVRRNHSKLLAYKVSVSPGQDVEVGGTFFNHFGGAGRRSSPAWDRLIDFLPFIDIFRKHNYVDTTRVLDVESDKLLGVDGRIRFRQLAGMTVRGEALIDDFDVHRLQSMLTGTGSQYVNVTFPQVGDPALSVGVTAKHMGILTYTHTELTDGIASRSRLLGDELGPDAKSFSGELRWTTESILLSAEYRRAIYSSAIYTQFYSDPAQTISVVQKLSSLPDETRNIGMFGATLKPSPYWSFTARAGAQQVANYNFSGQRRRDYVAELWLRMAQ